MRQAASGCVGFFRLVQCGLCTLRLHFGDEYPFRPPAIRFASPRRPGCPVQRSVRVTRAAGARAYVHFRVTAISVSSTPTCTAPSLYPDGENRTPPPHLGLGLKAGSPPPVKMAFDSNLYLRSWHFGLATPLILCLILCWCNSHLVEAKAIVPSKCER